MGEEPLAASSLSLPAPRVQSKPPRQRVAPCLVPCPPGPGSGERQAWRGASSRPRQPPTPYYGTEATISLRLMPPSPRKQGSHAQPHHSGPVGSAHSPVLGPYRALAGFKVTAGRGNTEKKSKRSSLPSVHIAIECERIIKWGVGRWVPTRSPQLHTPA